MKVAILISGQTRYSEIAAKEFKKHIDKATFDIDIFVQCWLPHIESPLHWGAKKHIHQETSYLVNKRRELNLPTDQFAFEATFGQFYGFYEAAQLIDNPEQYDYILKIRHDSWYAGRDFNKAFHDFLKYEEELYERYYHRAGNFNRNIIFVNTVFNKNGFFLIHDYLFIGKPANILNYINGVDLVFKYGEPPGDMHRAWALLAEETQTDIIGLDYNHMYNPLTADFHFNVLRPGVENLHKLDFESVNYLEQKYFKDKHRLDP